MNKVDPFYTAYRGSFSAILKWPELDGFWLALKQRAGENWYAYTIGEPPPASPLSAEQLLAFIDSLDARLREEHKEDYCGIVYVDDKSSPSYIKIYDPKNLGVVCGISREPIFPGWIISLLPAKPIEELPPLEEEKKSWWKKLFG